MPSTEGSRRANPGLAGCGKPEFNEASGMVIQQKRSRLQRFTFPFNQGNPSGFHHPFLIPHSTLLS
jgi:hypothetical protein